MLPIISKWWCHSRKALRKDFVCKEIHFTLPLSFLFFFLQIFYAIHLYFSDYNLENEEDLDKHVPVVFGVILGIFCIYATEKTWQGIDIGNGFMQKRELLCGLIIVSIIGYLGIYELFMKGPVSTDFFISFLLLNITIITIYFLFFHGKMIPIKRGFYYKFFILHESITFLMIGLGFFKPGNSIVFWVFLAYLTALCSHSLADIVLLINDILRHNPIEEEEEESPAYETLDPSKLMETKAYRDLSVDCVCSLPRKKNKKNEKN